MAAGRDADPHGAAIAADLTRQGWCIRTDFLSQAESGALRAQARTLHEGGAFRAAAVGHGQGRHTDTGIRGDEIHWLGATQVQGAAADLLDRMERLRLGLNERCLLGLFDLEMHFARYAPGSRYARHLDRFRDDSTRVVSCVLYLNEAWHQEDGGLLRLYTDPKGDACIEVTPAAGTLITFLSERFPHEVLPALRERWSVTGWFRARAPVF